MKLAYLLLLILLTNAASAGIESIAGKWIIVDFVSAPIYALSPEEAKQTIKRGMILYPDWYVTHTQNVKHPIFKERIFRSEDEFFSEYRMTFDDFGISTESVTEYEVLKTDGTPLSGYGSVILKISEKRLAIGIDGLFVIYGKS